MTFQEAMEALPSLPNTKHGRKRANPEPSWEECKIKFTLGLSEVHEELNHLRPKIIFGFNTVSWLTTRVLTINIQRLESVLGKKVRTEHLACCNDTQLFLVVKLLRVIPIYLFVLGFRLKDFLTNTCLALHLVFNCFSLCSLGKFPDTPQFQMFIVNQGYPVLSILCLPCPGQSHQVLCTWPFSTWAHSFPKLLLDIASIGIRTMWLVQRFIF